MGLGGGGGGTPEVDETDEVNVAGVAFCEVFLFCGGGDCVLGGRGVGEMGVGWEGTLTGDFASFFTVLHCATTG